jgi:hypothetical protein
VLECDDAALFNRIDLWLTREFNNVTTLSVRNDNIDVENLNPLRHSFSGNKDTTKRWQYCVTISAGGGLFGMPRDLTHGIRQRTKQDDWL